VNEQRHPRGTSADPPEGRETFGRYQLLGLLGQGGMGRLYIAERRGIQGFVKIVALKVILPHLADSAQLREMFLNEARIAAKLEHPNIVVTYELGEFEGKYFIAMEYLPGEDFSAIVTRCQGALRVPIEIASALAQQAAQGLHYAHDARDQQGRPIGLVHRDVNLRNIFLTYHGAVKLLDFGVVRGREGQRTVPGAFKGKYGYCAPEQLDGGQVDRRTDVFCLGIVLWELLTGTPLFDGGSDAKTIDAVRSRRVEAPSVLRPEIPPALDEIVLRALQRDPARRFQSAHDLSEELDAFLLERDTRPSSKSLGRWLESIFGAERASLKKAISQGAPVEGTLDRLAALEPPGSRPGSGSGSGASTPRPRALWSTNTGDPTTGVSNTIPPLVARPATTLTGAAGAMPNTNTGASQAPPARRGTSIPTVVGGVAVVGILALVAFRGLAPHPAGEATSAAEPTGGEKRSTASVAIESLPRGADVFVDGSPSGLKTPVVLTGLKVGGTVQIRLDKEGFEPAAESTRIEAGPRRTLTFHLHAAGGTIRVVGAPKRAAVYLDDVAVADADRPFPAPSGPHRVRIEIDQTVLLSKTIEVGRDGETVLKADREGKTP
jgi:serine/threonine protein kinase